MPSQNGISCKFCEQNHADHECPIAAKVLADQAEQVKANGRSDAGGKGADSAEDSFGPDSKVRRLVRRLARKRLYDEIDAELSEAGIPELVIEAVKKLFELIAVSP